ncbi:MAG: hypothetical protein Q9191_001517 [Dirinaria sp. TL-2023a]
MATIRADSESSALPLEILAQITSFLNPPRGGGDLEACQLTLSACCLVSRMWYCAAVGLLYENPYITGCNYERFVATICPSINAHVRKNGLANLVKTLDLHRLVYHGSKSKTARLLGRVKSQLEVYVAPQANFGSVETNSGPLIRLTVYRVTSLAALGKCKNLHHLDLSLVSEALNHSDLSHSLSKLEQLDFLAFPRAGKVGLISVIRSLPSNLRECHLNCTLKTSIYSHEPRPLVEPNYKLTRLKLPSVRLGEFWSLQEYLPNLEYLTIGPPASRGSSSAFDASIFFFSSIQHLRLPVECLTDWFFDPPDFFESREQQSLLRIELDSGDLPAAFEEKSICDSIWDAVTTGIFPNLRTVGVHRSLDGSFTLGRSEDAEDLNQLLQALAREDGDKARLSEDLAGVYTFGE